jgi:hypothetical protein
VLLKIVTGAAEQWAEAYIGRTNGFQPFWPVAVVVEPRYVADVVAGAREAGLAVWV